MMKNVSFLENISIKENNMNIYYEFFFKNSFEQRRQQRPSWTEIPLICTFFRCSKGSLSQGQISGTSKKQATESGRYSLCGFCVSSLRRNFSFSSFSFTTGLLFGCLFDKSSFGNGLFCISFTAPQSLEICSYHIKAQGFSFCYLTSCDPFVFRYMQICPIHVLFDVKKLYFKHQ